MDVHYPTIDEPATPEYVFSVFCDLHRLDSQAEYGCDPDESLRYDMTLDEWFDAQDCEFPPSWWDLGRHQNEFWGMNCSKSEWRGALKPMYECRLSDLCHFIAMHAFRPRIRAARLFGSNCAPAGAFLTIRSMFHGAGAPVRDIAPSTPLAPYFRRYHHLIGSIAKIAPGSLPPIRVRNPKQMALVFSMLIGFLLLLIGLSKGLSAATISGIVLLANYFVLSWFYVDWSVPTSVEIGELRTFRDLANAIARQNTPSADGEERIISV